MRRIDMTGQRFGKLTVIERTDERTNNGSVIYKCQCDCGNVANISAQCLTRRDYTTSCGCARGNDLTDKKFHRLTIIKRVENKGNRRMWLCKCDCGNEAVVSAHQLTSGKTCSCGCHHREQTSKASIIHGASRGNNRLYGIWKNMKSRCYCPGGSRYDRYGKRGIAVCDEWKDDFAAFENGL